MVNIDIANNVAHPSSKVELALTVTLAPRMFFETFAGDWNVFKIELMLSLTVRDTDDRDDGCVYWIEGVNVFFFNGPGQTVTIKICGDTVML